MTEVYFHIGRSKPESITGLRPAVFLDRDGVITEETHYLHRPEDVQFIPGALEAVSRMNELGLAVVLVTNQSGVGRGYYGWQDFELVQTHIESALSARGGWVDGVWACGYDPDGTVDESARYYRKPNPGMLIDAAAKLKLDLSDSWLVGDKPSDIETAINAGLRRAVHVLTGYGRETRSEVVRLGQEKRSSCEIHFCDAVADVVSLLMTVGA